MFKMLKTVALSALIGIGAIGATSAPAMADSIRFSFGTGAHVGYYGGYHRDHRDWRRGGYPRDHHGYHGRRDHRHYGSSRHHRSCSTGEAVRKASGMGVRYARVAYAGSRTIKVSGYARYHPVSVVFSRAPSCPVVG